MAGPPRARRGAAGVELMASADVKTAADAKSRPSDVVPPSAGFPAALRSPGVLGRIARSWNSRVGFAIVALLVLLAVVGPAIIPHDPLERGASTLQGPTWEHPLGTDRLGRDMLSRVVAGARLSLLAAFLVTIMIVIMGFVVGSITGLVGGAVDAVLMRIVDMLLALPSLILGLAIAGFFRPSLITLMLALTSVTWGGYARLVRGLVLSLRESEFVAASRALGGTHAHILGHHVVPMVLPHLVVLATLEMGSIVLAISFLSFLGLGVQPPTPEWGAMVNEGRTFFVSAPHVLLVPGMAISLAVLGFNLLGDGLRDAIDPKLVERRG